MSEVVDTCSDSDCSKSNVRVEKEVLDLTLSTIDVLRLMIRVGNYTNLA